jgi:uncharacterized protein (DUF58 family)
LTASPSPAGPSLLLSPLFVLAILAFVLGLVVGRFELLFVALPLVVALLSVRRAAAASAITITTIPSATSLVEDDRLDLALIVTSPETAASLEIYLPLPATFVVVDGKPHLATSLRAGETFEWKVSVRSTARGRCRLGPFNVRLSDSSGLSVDEALVGAAIAIETYPRIPRVQQLPRPTRTRSSFGNIVSAQLGPGLEPAEIRPFAPGDRVRQINWPASLRLRQLYVTQFHQERNADVILLLDTLAETGAHPHSSLDACVQAVAALASAYIARKDRVGLVEFGGYLRWLKPAAGRRQLQALLQAAVSADQVFTYAARNLEYVPSTALPRQALVIAVSPVIDERFTTALLDLAGRGYDVVLLAVSPVELTRRVLPDTRLDNVACTLWQLEQAARIQQLRNTGITVSEWQPERPLETALAPLARRAPVRGAAL